MDLDDTHPLFRALADVQPNVVDNSDASDVEAPPPQGQGYLKCGCAGGCKAGGKGAGCKCLKAGAACNSRCHPGKRNCTNQVPAV
jgi:hypothetical protein